MDMTLLTQAEQSETLKKLTASLLSGIL